MKFSLIGALALSISVGLAACAGGCGTSGTLHAPTQPGNVATTVNTGYGVAGLGVRQFLKLKLCETPPAYPCATQAQKDKVDAADEAAYRAAVAADVAGASTQLKQAKDEKAKALKEVMADPEITRQLKLAADAGG
jgi:hypothetical protein